MSLKKMAKQAHPDEVDTEAAEVVMKRSRLLIYPKFQLLLLILQLLTLVGVLVPVFLAIRSSFQELSQLAMQAGLPPDHSFFRLLELGSQRIQAKLILPLVLGFLASAFFALAISHRLAGPIVRLRGYFRRVAETGTPEKVFFRKGDFFQELPELINAAVERLSEDAPARQEQAERDSRIE